MASTNKSQQCPITETWKQYTASGSPQARSALIEHYLPLVRMTAERMHAKLPGFVELDDMISSGTFGLMSAVNSFDPGRDIKFETYCITRIRGAMLDELRSMDWVPRLARFRYRKLNKAMQSLEASGGQPPTSGELASRMGVSAKIAQAIVLDARIVGQVSLEHSAYRSADGDCRIGDVIVDKRSEDPSHIAMRRDLKEAVVRGLSRTERMVVLMYLCEEMTMREIGAVLGLSESRVSQIYSELMLHLRCVANSRRSIGDAA